MKTEIDLKIDIGVLFVKNIDQNTSPIGNSNPTNIEIMLAMHIVPIILIFDILEFKSFLVNISLILSVKRIDSNEITTIS
ncbi:MAG: hypothetical protein ACFE9N_13740, partial [Promethearchaeota archaeon]